MCTAYISLSLSLLCPLDRAPLSSGPRHRVFPDNGTLLVLGVRKGSDEGSYACAAEDRAGRADSAETMVTVVGEDGEEQDKFGAPCPTTNGGTQNGSSVEMCTHCLRVSCTSDSDL